MPWRLILACIVGLAAAGATTLQADDLPAVATTTAAAAPAVSISPFAPPVPVVPVEEIAPDTRDKVRYVLEKPTLSSRSVPETFNTDHAVYRYLLDHPDHAVKLWRLLGAKVAEIDDRGSGTYVWHDGQGSEVTWQIVHRGSSLHVWYAEGKVKPGALFAAHPFRAVAMMQYTEGVDVNGLPAVRHQVHFHLRCESRAVALAARIMGGSAPRLAEQYLTQLQMFYGGMAWYTYQDDARAKKLFDDAGLTYPVPGQQRGTAAQ
jgi:hypothetical protein